MSAESKTPIRSIDVSAFDFGLDPPHSDGTLQWNRITLVVVEVKAGNRTGIGYTYADHSTARLIHDTLSGAVVGLDAMDVARCWERMVRRIRNLGRPGIASMAISAVDAAIWDLKAKLLGLPLASLLGRVRDSIPVYGSGYLASATRGEAQTELESWIAQGVGMFKMKIGRAPDQDIARVRHARRTIGSGRQLFVDANGAYSPKEALTWAERLKDLDVRWFEEPVSSDDLRGLSWLRSRGPAGMSITAGEYGYDLPYFRRMLEAEAVDILQADASRCGGITGFLEAASLCHAHGILLSSHTAPSLHASVCCAAIPVCHLEYFSDHVAIEERIFEGFLRAKNGVLLPDLGRPGLGIELKRKDAERLAA